MRNAMLVARREIATYLRSPLGYIVVAVALLIIGVLFYADPFRMGGLGSGATLSAQVLSGFFYYASGPAMILCILLSMRLLAGEREHGTLVLLNTAPIRDVEIVVGKFLSALAFMAVTIALTVYMPLLIFVNGKVSVGHILVGYTGLLLLSSATLAIGLLGSAIARTQVIAVIVGAVLWGLMILLWAVAKVTDPPLNDFIAGVALHHERFKSFAAGVLKLENVLFYLVVTYFLLLATTKTLEARRWR